MIMITSDTGCEMVERTAFIQPNVKHTHCCQLGVLRDLCDVEIVMEEEVDSASENPPDVQEPAGGQIRVRLSMGNHE